MGVGVTLTTPSILCVQHLSTGTVVQGEEHEMQHFGGAVSLVSQVLQRFPSATRDPHSHLFSNAEMQATASEQGSAI